MRAVARVAVGDFDRRDNVRLDAAHEVNLNHARFSISCGSLYFACTHWTKRQVDRPDESTAKSSSIARRGKLLSSMSILR